ncbi:transcription termination factor Rho [Nocardioides mesophilus]|uniref:Transcription termination factor Rho n=2 Tax=Nocardioides mesophilus TaxID=433659 RepID=A0A7G9R8M8_9ACTN|nr:transcription termination factor Rho [Nocardioides mesophilus]
MTETTATPPESAPSRKRAAGLSGMLLPELKQMAGGLGIKGAGGMRKSQLIDAIKAAQSGGQSAAPSGPSGDQSSGPSAGRRSAGQQPEADGSSPVAEAPARSRRGRAERTAGERTGEDAGGSTDQQPQDRGDQGDSRGEQRGARTSTRTERTDRSESRADVQPGERTDDRGDRADTRDNRGDRADARGERGDRADTRGERTDNRGDRTDTRDNRGERTDSRGDRGDQGRGDNRGDRTDNRGDRTDTRDNRGDRGDRTEDRGDQGRGDNRHEPRGDRNDDGTSRRNRRRRGRDRTDTRDQGPGVRSDRSDRGDRSNRGSREPDTQILEDDVLVPVAGILDVLDNYAFVRTSGYLPGSDDVYVSLSMVRKLGLRRGDAITGMVRSPREGERKEKFNPLVRIDTVNGADPEAAKGRVEFQKLTPLYPSERLRLETESTNLIGRVIDIAAPIGKGQRGLIVSPSKAGKTMIMQSIANSITTNNPECHLMVVLVDERPEEVTDFQRSVKGEVISSTFDRPASDHTAVAELAIERAKRLVELGHDVVVLLDGITRLGRAYNLAAPASGRILSGGVDSAALYPPKRFFGAARNIEDGGSLTIMATALIESGSKMDEVIFEEFKGTGNMEIRLRRDFADKRLFPAIDAVQSGTRREELLMSKEELAIVWKLRRVLSGLDGQQALELLLERLKKTHSNIEFLMQVQKTTPMAGNNGD